MRNLNSVIDQILGAIVGEGCTDFNARLRSIKNSVEYCPPESMGIWWQETLSCIIDELGVYDENHKLIEPNFPLGSWQDKVIKIWMGKN